MERIVITGASGLLGQAVTAHFSALKGSQIVGTIARQPRIDLPNAFACDLSQERETVKLLRDLNPTVVFHLAAFTDLAECEHNPQKAIAINATASAIVARATRGKARLIAFSTDSVFEGSRGNYDETSIPAPVNQYAQSKRLGELAVQAEHPESLIVRGNLYGMARLPRSGKLSLVEWAVGEWSAGRVVTGYANVIFNPLYVGQVAELLAALGRKPDVAGTLHIGSSESLSKETFLRRLLQRCGFPDNLVVSGEMQSSQNGIRRPLDTSLNVRKSVQLLGRSWSINEGLDTMARDFLLGDKQH